jgi:hypothetical protein
VEDFFFVLYHTIFKSRYDEQNVPDKVRDGFLSLHAAQLLCNDYVSVEPIAQGQTFSLSFKEFTKFSLPYLTEINKRVKESLAAQKLPVVPMIVFAKGAHYALAQLGQSGYEVVGLDWTVRPEEARRLVSDNVSLQVRIGFISLLIRVVVPYPVDLQLIGLLFVKDSIELKKKSSIFSNINGGDENEQPF